MCKKSQCIPSVCCRRSGVTTILVVCANFFIILSYPFCLSFDLMLSLRNHIFFYVHLQYNSFIVFFFFKFYICDLKNTFESFLDSRTYCDHCASMSERDGYTVVFHIEFYIFFLSGFCFAPYKCVWYFL